jgi:hypothetical protein
VDPRIYTGEKQTRRKTTWRRVRPDICGDKISTEGVAIGKHCRGVVPHVEFRKSQILGGLALFDIAFGRSLAILSAG